MGTLFIVATPIGNLQDITIRAIETLFSVYVIACEDTRRTGILLSSINNLYSGLVHYSGELKHKPKLVSYYDQNELQRIPEIIGYLKNNLNVALVSDAGTPLISDPGFKLVRECIKKGIKIESIPGPSSAISALVSSGLPTDKFLFLGYLPKKHGKRISTLTSLQELFSQTKSIRPSIIFFEVPHRLVESLIDIQTVFGIIEIVICRELTKIHEEIIRGKISELIQKFQTTKPKGELVILFGS